MQLRKLEVTPVVDERRGNKIFARYRGLLVFFDRSVCVPPELHKPIEVVITSLLHKKVDGKYTPKAGIEALFVRPKLSTDLLIRHQGWVRNQNFVYTQVHDEYVGHTKGISTLAAGRLSGFVLLQPQRPGWAYVNSLTVNETWETSVTVEGVPYLDDLQFIQDRKMSKHG